MTIAEKVNQSANGTLFTVHKEGLFYKYYNEDAMVFVQKVRKYKVSSKFVKATISNLHSIGFPASEVEKGKLSFDDISTKIEAQSFTVQNDIVVFILDKEEAKIGYNQWVENLQSFTNEVIAKDPEPLYLKMNTAASIIAMLRNYDLANSTPMQGLNFIQQLKSELNRIDTGNGNV